MSKNQHGKSLRAIAINALDQLSRYRALTDDESLALERCLKEENAIPQPTPILFPPGVGWPMYQAQGD